MPASVPSSASERATLLPSPTYATRTPSSVPHASRSVSRSASAWQGWCRAVSMLTTGTERARPAPSSLVGARAHADRGDVAGEHQRRVAQRLAARELQLIGAQHDRMAAELVDPHLEGHARARRGLLEYQRHLAPLQGAARQRRRLQLERPVEQCVELCRAELGAGEKMAAAWSGQSRTRVRTVTAAQPIDTG